MNTVRDEKGRFIKGIAYFKGRHHHPESIEKLRQVRLGKPLSLETKMKQRQWMLEHPNSGQFQPLQIDISNKPNLAYLIGVLLGDGTYGKWRRASYGFQLAITNKDIAKQFADALSIINLNPHWDMDTRSHRNLPLFRVRAHSEQLFNWITTISIDGFVTSSKDNAKQFLKGFFESEGEFGDNGKGSKYIRIWNTDLVKLNLVQHVLEMFNFRARLHEKKLCANHWGSKPVYCVRSLGGTKEAYRFMEVFNPCRPLTERQNLDPHLVV